jgi:hypothetical protein
VAADDADRGAEFIEDLKRALRKVGRGFWPVMHRILLSKPGEECLRAQERERCVIVVPTPEFAELRRGIEPEPSISSIERYCTRKCACQRPA